MINTLLLILLVIFVGLITTWAITQVSIIVMVRRSYSEAMGTERFEADRVVDPATLDAPSRKTWLRWRNHHIDPAYQSMRTKSLRGMNAAQRHGVAEAEKLARQQYLEQAHLGITHYIVVFIVFSMLGLVGEELWMWHSQGLTQSRVGVIWGPFSPLYGFGALLFTIVLWNFRDSHWYEIFCISMGAGAAIEQVTGMCMEYFWHAQSWTYIGLPDAITQWICWSSIIVWGVLGLVFTKWLLPEFVWRLGEPSRRTHAVMCGVLVAFMTIDLLATAYCFYRMEQRSMGIPPQNTVDVYVDSHFNDQFIEQRFQNLVVGSQLAPNG